MAVRLLTAAGPQIVTQRDDGSAGRQGDRAADQGSLVVGQAGNDFHNAGLRVGGRIMSSRIRQNSDDIAPRPISGESAWNRVAPARSEKGTGTGLPGVTIDRTDLLAAA
jgi:hypothetical protein